MLWLFPVVVSLPRRPDMSLSKEINGDLNGAVEIKIDNLFRKKRAGAVSTLNERRKQKRIIRLNNTKTRLVNKSKNKH